MHYQFCHYPKALEGILANEVEMLGENVRQKLAGVAFQGIRNRIHNLLMVARHHIIAAQQLEVKSQQDLYDGIQRIDWFERF